MVGLREGDVREENRKVMLEKQIEETDKGDRWNGLWVERGKDYGGGGMNRLKKITSKTGESLPIISNDETFKTYEKVKTLEAKTLLKLALNDENILKLLTTHRSNLSPFKKFNYPLLFSLNAQRALPFGLMAEKESIKVEHTVGQIGEKTKPNLERLVKMFETKCVPLIEQLEADNLITDLEEEKREEYIKTKIIQAVMKEMSDENQMMKIIKLFEDDVIDDIIPTGLSIINSMKDKILKFGIEHRNNLLKASKFEKDEDYKKVIETLEHELKVIKPLLSIYWCENKIHEHFSLYMTTHSSNPEIKCPICNKELSSGTFYYFIPEINYLLRRREGLIKSLVMHILDSGSSAWNSSVYFEKEQNDSEKDFVIETDEGKYCIIEVKNYATDVPQRAKQEHIKQALNQISNHINSYESMNVDISQVILITNYWKDEELERIRRELLEDVKYEKIKRYNFKLFGPGELHNLQKLFGKVAQ
ncbi:MAG: hypothetical protein KBONHNOK_00788 [Candidatus Methanoperedenaceae archaeon GB50]|nr:MAG: hypothetical protein KBONHNOK_00788 [Candidatus Methanoperedenaceae archaeon GB50]